MVDTNKLKKKIEESGYNVESFSKLVSIDKSTFYRKLAGEGDGFTIKETDKICKSLKLNKDEVLGIFFTQYVAWRATLAD